MRRDAAKGPSFAGAVWTVAPPVLAGLLEGAPMKASVPPSTSLKRSITDASSCSIEMGSDDCAIDDEAATIVVLMGSPAEVLPSDDNNDAAATDEVTVLLLFALLLLLLLPLLLSLEIDSGGAEPRKPEHLLCNTSPASATALFPSQHATIARGRISEV